jgi:hypothetical protein
MIAKIEGNQMESTKRWFHALCLPAEGTPVRRLVDLALKAGVDFYRHINECDATYTIHHLLVEHGLSARDYLSIQNDITDCPRMLPT